MLISPRQPEHLREPKQIRFDEPGWSRLHDKDIIAHINSFGDRMRNEYYGGVKFMPQLQQEILHLQPGIDVQCSEWFIH